MTARVAVTPAAAVKGRTAEEVEDEDDEDENYEDDDGSEDKSEGEGEDEKGEGDERRSLRLTYPMRA